jgi:hypothetical protein
MSYREESAQEKLNIFQMVGDPSLCEGCKTNVGAERGTRTPTPLLTAADFKSAASASSAIPAFGIFHFIWRGENPRSSAVVFGNGQFIDLSSKFLAR